MDTLIRQHQAASGSSELQAVDVDDIALLHLRAAAACWAQ